MKKRQTAKQREAQQRRIAKEYNETLQHIYQALKEMGAESYYTTVQRKGVVKKKHLQVQDIVQHNVLNVKRIQIPTKAHVKQLKAFLKDNKKMIDAIYNEFLKKQKTTRYLTPNTEEYTQHEKLVKTVGMYKTIKDINRDIMKMKMQAADSETKRKLNEVQTAIEIIARYTTDLEIMIREIRQEFHYMGYMHNTKRRMKHAQDMIRAFKQFQQDIQNPTKWDLIIYRASMLERITREYGRPNTKYMVYYDNADADSVPYVEIEEKLNNVVNTQEVIKQSLTGKSTKEENESFIKEQMKRLRKNLHGLV